MAPKHEVPVDLELMDVLLRTSNRIRALAGHYRQGRLQKEHVLKVTEALGWTIVRTAERMQGQEPTKPGPRGQEALKWISEAEGSASASSPSGKG